MKISNKVSCELCSLPATTYCESDEAKLCWKCDSKVHKANFLVNKHSRNLLCHLCQNTTPWFASGPMLPPCLSLCLSCATPTPTTNHDDHVMHDQSSSHHDVDVDDGCDSYDDDHDDEEEEEEDEEDEDEEDEEEEEDEDNQVVPLTTSSPSSSSPVSSIDDVVSDDCIDHDGGDNDDIHDEDDTHDGGGGGSVSPMVPSLSLKRKRECYVLS